MKKTVIAVIGCGRIANNAHFPAFAQMDDLIEIKYACDLIPEKAQAMKDKYPAVQNVITDYHVTLDDPEVEAVYVLTPNYAHYTVTMDALKAGKHVFCEKP
ncbi:MAG: Gfo/Idh/MocA family oxidoreductase, partial [Clostridia bacterium]|nr:Gfo/Idh/MocA family oxidoreductase [Clostridia bacterium]